MESDTCKCCQCIPQDILTELDMRMGLEIENQKRKVEHKFMKKINPISIETYEWIKNIPVCR